MGMKLRLGVIGLGVISRYYLNALRTSEVAELAAVCDRDEATLSGYRGRGLPAFRDWHELLARKEVEAIVVCLPNDLHFAACADALKAGKHICCEKPLTTSLAQADELVRLSRASGRVLFTAFHRRYNVHLLRLLKELPGLEAVARVTASYLENIDDHVGSDLWNLDPARCGGGCVADNGPNVFDALSFLGRLRVRAAELEYSAGTDVRARIRLVNESDIPAEVRLDWKFPGERKDVAVELRDGRVLRADLLHGFTVFKSSLEHEYQAILSDFAARVRRGKGHGEAGRDAVRLVEETYRLTWRGAVREG